MIDSAIQKFFEDRKEAWLKKNIKASMDESEELEIRQECEQVFSLENWLPNAAKRAGQISMSTHPCTFSHPSARKNKNDYVTSVLCDAAVSVDGFLKTGSVTVETDALGNAAALDVYKFLTIELSDKKQLIEHIKQETDLAKNLLDIYSESYSVLKDGFLEMSKASQDAVTSSKIKQVYFPVLENYHQLSLLTNSGMIYELRKRIDNSRFSEQVKEKRELRKKGEYSDQGYMELYNLTTIGFGGTKPQNISVLNNKNGGKTHLLDSSPPKLQFRSIRFPKTNFFKESFYLNDCQDVFQALHKIFLTDYNNINIRETHGKKQKPNRHLLGQRGVLPGRRSG